MEDNNEKSDIQLDMDALSYVRDNILKKIKSAKNLENGDLNALSASLINVIKARQDSELLQLRLWGVFDNIEHDEDCPECNEQLTKLPDPSN